MKPSRLPLVRRSLALLLPLFVVLGAALPCRAQFSGPRVRIPAVRPLGVIAPKPAAPAAADGEKEESESRFAGGASLKTDRELERLLERAAQFAQNQRFDLASVLWQRILDESGDVLRTSDGRLYTALANEVESLLKQMPEEARTIYRIKADGEAQALLAQAEGENGETQLGKIVRRYFMSSFGDDAAYQLACIALDRHDFVGARRLLERVLHEHPDASVPRGALLLRHAVAAARSGDLDAAKQSLAQARREPDLDDADLVARVEEVVAAASSDAYHQALEPGEWPIAWGTPNRKGLMPAIPSKLTNSTLTDYWSRPLQGDAPPQLTQAEPVMPGGRRVIRSGGFMLTPTVRRGWVAPGVVETNVAQQANVVENWKRNNWTPTTELAFSSGKLLLRTHYDIEAWPIEQLGKAPSWTSAWFNSFDLDAMTQSSFMMGMVDPAEPMGVDGVRGFGDRIHGMTTIVGDVAYTIEGRRFSKQAASNGPPPQEVKQTPWGVVPRRSRTNYLAAYDVASGKALWNRPASDDPTSVQDIGFLAAPTPCGDLLLAPVTDAGTIYLYALNPQTGETVWKSYLCDEPPGGASPWTPATVTVEGADAYVVCGAGVVFSVDGLSGAIHWAVRYERDSLRAARTQRNYNGMPSRFRAPGWADDVALPIGKALVIFASDQNVGGESQLFALDRLTGEFLWQSPRISPFNTDASYFLGAWKRGVIVGGRNVVRMYDAISGRLVWDRELKQSLGRGAMTSDAIYVPDRDSIVILDPDTGREIKQVGVRLSTGDPVGNLFIDGKQIWVANHDRVYALTNLELRLQELAERIEKGDLTARIARIQLYERLGREIDAAADVETLFLAEVAANPAGAHERLFNQLRSLKLVSNWPVETLQLLCRIQAEADAATNDPALAKHRAGRDDAAMTAVNAILQQRPASAVDAILQSKSLFTSPQMVFAAANALRNAASKADSARLAAEFETNDPRSQMLVVAALAEHGDEAGRGSLKAALKSSDDALRLAVAHELASAGDSAGLETLVDLLRSPKSEVRIRSHSDLCWLTGRFAPLPPLAEEDALAKQQEQWRTWLAEPSLVLKTPLPELRPSLGRILICSAGFGKIYELDENLQDRWSIESPGVMRCAGLPNGHRLATNQQNNAAFLVEYDAQGALVKSAALRTSADSIERLASGSTLLALSPINQVIEVDEEGKTVWEISIAGQPTDARRLPGGRTLISLLQANRVVEIDEKGKVVWEASNLAQPNSARRLPNGNTLIALRGAGVVVEVDPDSKVVWTGKGLKMPRLVERLADGRTLVADAVGLHILNADGEIIASRTDLGPPSGLSAY